MGNDDFGGEGFGDVDFSGDSGGKGKYVKEKSIPEGTSRFRFLPPMKSLQGKRDGWRLWGAVHYGYSGTKRNKPDETVQRPFGCVQKKDRAGNIVLPCDGCIANLKRKDEAEAHAVRLKEQGLSKDQIREEIKMKQLNDWLWDHNCDKKFRVAALEADEQNYTIIKINFTLMKTIDALFRSLANDPENPINPLSVNQGVWLEFNRSGKDFRVDVVKERVNAPGIGIVEKIKLAPLTAQQQQDALARVQDLTTCISVLSPEQIKMIVNGPQDPESIDAVWALGQKSVEVSPDAVPVRTPAPSNGWKANSDLSLTSPTGQRVTLVNTVTEVGAEEDEEAAMLRKLEEIRRKKATVAVAPVPTPSAPPPGAEMSDEDFMRLVGGGGK